MARPLCRTRAKFPVADFAEGFLVDWRDGLWIATTATEQPQPAPVPPHSEILLGTRRVPVAGVTVWQE